MKKLDKQAARDITQGAAFLSCGGGGTLTSSLEMVEKHFPVDATIDLVEVDDVADDASTLTVACTFIGSPTKGTDVTDPTPVIHALDRFAEIAEAHTGKKVARVVALELGVQSSVAPDLCVAQARGLGLVDADGASRTILGIQSTTFSEGGVTSDPGVTANATGVTAVIETADPSVWTDVAFAVATAKEFGVAGMAIFAMDGPTLKRVTSARGTIDWAHRIGVAMRTADAPVDAVLDILRKERPWAGVLAEGTVTSVDTTAEDRVMITLADTTADRTITIVTYGSNLIVYGSDSDRPVAMSPDSICWLTRDGKTLSNTELQPDTAAALIGFSAAPWVRTGAIGKEFDLLRRSAGYAGAYVPIEDLHGG